MKKYFRMKPYLKYQLPRIFVKSIAAFRLSTHKLEIEIGRYHKPTPTPVSERVYQQCASGEVEDEVHFLFTCTKYERERDILKSKLTSAGYELGMNPTCMRNLFGVDNADMVYANW